MSSNGQIISRLPANGAVHPWLRLPDESPQAFEAFSLYCSLGADRGLPEVSQRLSKSRGLMKRWSARWSWLERVRAYDNHQAIEINHAVLSNLVQQARQLQQRAGAALQAMTKGDMESVSVAEVCLMLKTVCSLAECTGMAESNGSPMPLPQPTFTILTYTKPDDCCWCRLDNDPDGRRAFFIPQELAGRFRETFGSECLVIA